MKPSVNMKPAVARSEAAKQLVHPALCQRTMSDRDIQSPKSCEIYPPPAFSSGNSSLQLPQEQDSALAVSR